MAIKSPFSRARHSTARVLGAARHNRTFCHQATTTGGSGYMLTLKLLIGLTGVMPMAANDNNVEWSGISHYGFLDRSPICPVGGESFEVSIQARKFDLTAVRVFVDDGAGVFVDAAWSHNVGPYDVWKATIPATGSSSLSYYFELTDGTDTDYYSVNGMSDGVPGDGGFIIDYATVSHAPIGATLTSDGGAAFKVWAPSATDADVRGIFNAWGQTQMNTDNNYWWVHVPGNVNPVDPFDNYKFYFSNSIWQRDARGRAYNPNDNDNSIIIDSTAYQWNDHGYTPPPFEEMVIYELHVGTFSGRNDGLGNRMGRFRDIVDTHLDHLLYLGVNMVELMPVHEFDSFNSWGYNPTNFFGVEESYGESAATSPDDLKYTIDKLHQAGIGVIADIVYNHFSVGGNFMWCYDGGQIYFDGTCGGGHVDTPWGAQADFDRDEVADYFADNILYWLEEYHFDGYRMDATQFMRDTGVFPGGQPSGWNLMRRINDLVDRRAAHKIMIAEELPDSTAITNPTSIGGAGFDSQWHDFFIDTVRQEVNDAAFGDPEMFKIRDAINASGFPNKTRLVRYVESHDEPGNEVRLPVMIDGGNPQSIWARGRSKFAQSLAMLSPGIPMFFQGCEWIEEQEFDSQFAFRLDWNKAVSRAPLVLFFRDLISVRRSNCGMRSDGGFNVYKTDDTNNVIVFSRGLGAELVVVASLNNGNLNNYRIGMPHGGTWYEVLNSQASVYDGNGAGNGGSVNTESVAWDGFNDSAVITIPQMGVLVFRFNDPLGRSPDLNSDSKVDLFDYFILQQRVGDAGCGMDADFNEDGTVSDLDLEVLVNSMTGP